MSLESHIKKLQDNRNELEENLALEMARPNPDFFAIKDIKKQKLLIKEEITRLMNDNNIQNRKDAS